VSEPIIGKLYLYINEFITVGMYEHQYINSYVSTLIRLEKLHSRPIKSITGFDLPNLSNGNTILVLDIEERYFTGNLYTIYKVLFQDKIIYLPMSEKKRWEDYFHLLEAV
jgi:hypothetical protein